jgi:hypothetical protein
MSALHFVCSAVAVPEAQLRGNEAELMAGRAPNEPCKFKLEP